MEPKILLIDDSAILRRIATNVLIARSLCSEVVTATRATEGFARACTSGVGLILVDYQIAGMPDAGLCRRLLAEARTNRIPVILLLSPGMMPPVKDVLPANIVDHLVKPFTPEQLVSAVKAALGTTLAGGAAGKTREASAAPVAAIRPVSTGDHRKIAPVVNVTTLARRETSRLLHPRAATSPSAASPPVPREMPNGRAHFDPSRLRTALLQAVRRHETGAFRVTAARGVATEVYLENGNIVVVATKDAKQYSEDAEGVVPPKVSPATFNDAVAEQAQTGVPFFLTLGARGLLSKTVAIGLLERFGQRQFARFCAAPSDSLHCEFVGMDALPGFALRLEPHRESADEWLLGTLRHLDSEDIAVLARHEGFTGTPSFKEEGMAMAAALRLNDQERDFCRQIGTRRDLASVARTLGITSEHAYLLLFRFRSLGIMDYRSTASAFVVTPRTNVRRVLPLHR